MTSAAQSRRDAAALIRALMAGDDQKYAEVFDSAENGLALDHLARLAASLFSAGQETLQRFARDPARFLDLWESQLGGEPGELRPRPQGPRKGLPGDTTRTAAMLVEAIARPDDHPHWGPIMAGEDHAAVALQLAAWLRVVAGPDLDAHLERWRAQADAEDEED